MFDGNINLPPLSLFAADIWPTDGHVNLKGDGYWGVCSICGVMVQISVAAFEEFWIRQVVQQRLIGIACPHCRANGDSSLRQMQRRLTFMSRAAAN